MVIIFYYILFLFIVSCKNKNVNISKGSNIIYLNNKNNDTKNNNSEDVQKRKLEEDYDPINIYINPNILFNGIEAEEIDFLKEPFNSAINRVNDIIKNLFYVKKSEKGVDLKKLTTAHYTKYTFLHRFNGSSLITESNNYNLIIFLLKATQNQYFPDNLFAKPGIIMVNENKRPIVGYIYFNTRYLFSNENNDDFYYKVYSSVLLHEIFHILGFMDEQFINFPNYNSIFGTADENRFNKGLKTIKIVKSQKILNLINQYYGENINGLELDDQEGLEGLPNSHWNARILLGDIMTSDLYFQEQVISEFTLALLEASGWYKINYFTGGLMRFGKNKKKEFMEKDCLQKQSDKVKSLFTNEFCTTSDGYGACSSGRLSKGYCNTKIEAIDDAGINKIKNDGYFRDWLSNDFAGNKYIEYCPVTNWTRTSNYNIFIGNCKIGNNIYGSEIQFIDNNNHDYTIFDNTFGEKFGNNSFCALSSILNKNDDNPKYKGLVRPTCYSMICSERSLTIEINDEYIVCPREGGMIKIGRDNSNYSNYKGYLFCPDYNLICTGDVMCNNLYDCVEKQSTYQFGEYDYEINNVFNEITSDTRTEEKLDLLTPSEGYELSNDNDAKCPINCSQCISNKRCILCRNFTKTEPHAYYIGEVDNDNNYINCSEFKPEKGYYETIKNINHIHYFRCINNCNACKNATVCDQCLPTHKISNNECIDRIPNCVKYNESTNFTDNITNGGGLGYKECEQCDNKNKYFCLSGNKTVCQYIPDYTNKTYYNMEERIFSCIERCNVTFEHCKECVKDRCIICEPEYFINSSGLCEERIPHCNKYNESSAFNDPHNGWGLGYSECEQCDNASNYYCFNNNKTICEELKDDISKYYRMDNKDYSCLRECKLEYPYCLECNRINCTKCIVDIKSSNGSCFPPIDYCLEYEKKSISGIEYLDCKKCDQNNNYFCLNNERDSCELIDNISYYYPLDESNDYSCLKKCEDHFPNCKRCDKNECFECNEGYILSNKNNTKCLIIIEPPADETCKVLIHNINTNIEELDFLYFIDFYFENTLPYTKYVNHFVNEKYTVTMFIYSECTEDLLNQGYYKIDSNELYQEMYTQAGIESNELLFSIFITYNYQNHYRFYNIYTEYINERDTCPNCLNIEYTITNKYPTVIGNIIGPALSRLLNNENIDIFSKESDIFTNSCANVTLEGIDIPFNERLYYLYLNDFSSQIACTGKDCILEEINTEKAISVCKCKMGNKFEDILAPKIEFKNYQDENMNKKGSISESFQVIKCAKNGFNKKNITANAGFYIAIIAIVLVIVSFISYCIWSKVINLKKLGNPPLKNKIIIISDWEINKNNLDENNKNNENDNELIQSRDEDDGNIVEEDMTFTNKYDSSSFSIDTEIGYKKKTFDSSKDKNKGLSLKTSKKILVLLANKRTIKNKDKGSQTNSEIEHEFIPTDKTKRKEKKTFCQIYWFVLSLKQHIINFFSNINCCKITESYVPLPMRIIKSTFIVVLSFLLNMLFLNQNYYSKKFKYFNQEYKLIVSQVYDYEIKQEEVSDGNIPTNELWKYAFKHTIIYSIIVFIILLVAQFIIGIVFFSLRKSVMEVINKNNLNEIKDLITKTKIKYIFFFILSLILLVLFLFVFIGFGGAYGGAYIDYFVPGLVSIAFLEIFPFIWSFILAIFRYIGIKENNRCCYEFSQFFLF